MYINISNRREVLWDDYLIEKEETTANLVMHKPVKKELAFSFNTEYEAHHFGYPHCILMDNTYYMYYVTSIPFTEEQEAEKQALLAKGVTPFDAERCFYVCVMTSRDFKNWEKPDVGLFEIDGNTHNNMILRQKRDENFEEAFDNIFVFKDENPNCPADEKVKAIAMCYNWKKEFPGKRELWCYTSPDGIHFKLGWKMMAGDEPNGGIFDSQNIAWYDAQSGKYKCYIRGCHKNYEKQKDQRDILYTESYDFKKWSVPVRLQFGECDDYQLYTNSIKPYARAPHMSIGLPTRYIEREAWSQNFEQLGGEENVRRRKWRMEKWIPRAGLAVTEVVFMSSRDGVNWNRFDEAFMGPGPEHERNWVYGDSSYPMYNLFETPCEYPSKEKELSIFMSEGAHSGEGIFMYRYAMRLDGFASYHSGYKVSTLTTKPLIFEGSELSINFASSAIGFVYVDVLDETGKPIEGYHSCELFGNTTDRTVYFGQTCDVSSLAGRPIKLRFTMRDADLYSFIFS